MTGSCLCCFSKRKGEDNVEGQRDEDQSGGDHDGVSGAQDNNYNRDGAQPNRGHGDDSIEEASVAPDSDPEREHETRP
ncbi:hypothetical protein MGN70_008625 [Eutypa lata]|nr:hypothetical protein MGN70_008625 [Eutypa lata]